MSKYYHPTTLEHISNPLPRVTEWAGEAASEAPAYDRDTETCHYRDGAWVVELSYNLEQGKEDKITELYASCRAHIFAGFDSDALGTIHHYPAQQDSTHQDQLNLNGLVTKSYEKPTGTFKFWCADSNGVWARREHTAEQIRQAGVDGANHVIAAQDKLAGLIDTINNATTKTELDSITW